jgi:hypothetical protein
MTKLLLSVLLLALFQSLYSQFTYKTTIKSTVKHSSVYTEEKADYMEGICYRPLNPAETSLNDVTIRIGRNEFIFNVNHLSPGNYILRIEGSREYFSSHSIVVN